MQLKAIICSVCSLMYLSVRWGGGGVGGGGGGGGARCTNNRIGSTWAIRNYIIFIGG